MKRKLLIFHKALAPYRIDFFNGLNEAFDANIYFFRKNLQSQKFDMDKLVKQLNFIPKYLTLGFELHYKGRMIRFGYIKKIIQFKPDIILCLEYSIITFITALFTKTFFTHTKVYSISDDSEEVAKNCSTSRKIGRALCLKYLDGVILGNELAKKWYNNNFPQVQTIVFPILQKEERIITIMNDAIPTSENYIQIFRLEGKVILLFVGRLVEVKNLNFLLDVFSQYVATNKNDVLILVGDGNKKEELINKVDQLGIKENVIFAGRYENEALYAWYRVADNFILPSTTEQFGAVVNESLIAGVPVLCSNLAGASCLVNERNGITFNPFDKEKLLTIFYSVLGKKRKSVNNLSIVNSLMPYTFNEKFIDLISFLQK